MSLSLEKRCWHLSGPALLVGDGSIDTDICADAVGDIDIDSDAVGDTDIDTDGVNDSDGVIDISVDIEGVAETDTDSVSVGIDGVTDADGVIEAVKEGTIDSDEATDGDAIKLTETSGDSHGDSIGVECGSSSGVGIIEIVGSYSGNISPLGNNDGSPDGSMSEVHVGHGLGESMSTEGCGGIDSSTIGDTVASSVGSAETYSKSNSSSCPSKLAESPDGMCRDETSLPKSLLPEAGPVADGGKSAGPMTLPSLFQSGSPLSAPWASALANKIAIANGTTSTKRFARKR